MPRLFTSVPLPEDVINDLMDLERPLRGARWIEADNFHLTLRFFGDVDNRTADEIANRLSTVTSDPIRLSLSGLAAFGGDKPHALYAAVKAPDELFRLQRAHEAAAQAAGLPAATRKFTPHVTVARLRGTRASEVAAICEETAGFASGPFAVDHVQLMSAKPFTGGGPYVAEAAMPLRGRDMKETRQSPENGAWQNNSADETTRWLARSLGEPDDD